MEPPSIFEAGTDSEFAAGRALFEEYAAALGVDLCFQDFASELAHVREIYGPPKGCLLLARSLGGLRGCIGVRPLEADVCEMKRLYVQPEARGVHLGRQLAVAAIDKARLIGYRRMVLDTLETLEPARRLYESLGFRTIAPYYKNPLEGVVYMELDLESSSKAYQRTHYVRLSAKAIIIKDGRLLVLKNRDAIGDWYMLPGGGQEHGETLLAALDRECLEEVGSGVTVGRLRFIRDYIARNHEFEAEGNAHQVELMFECELACEPSLGAKPDKLQTGIEWIELSDLVHHRLYPRILSQLLAADVGLEQPVYLGDVN